MGQHFARGGISSGNLAAGSIANASSADFDGILAARGILGLLAPHGQGKVPADGNDLGGPGDAGSVPKGPAAAEVPARRGVDVDHAPIGFRFCFAVNTICRPAAYVSEPIGPELIEHACEDDGGEGNAATAAATPNRDAHACCWLPRVAAETLGEGTAILLASLRRNSFPSASGGAFPALREARGNGNRSTACGIGRRDDCETWPPSRSVELHSSFRFPREIGRAHV